MKSIYHATCPRCGSPIDCEVEVGESVDIPDQCDECNLAMDEARRDYILRHAEADVIAERIDWLMDTREDR